MSHPDTPAPPRSRGLPHSSHWGAFSVLLRDGHIEIVPHPRDPDPSPLLGNIAASVSHRARIAEPMVRRGWLERGRRRSPAGTRRVRERAIFGGSYGWASAGRFHDAPRQLRPGTWTSSPPRVIPHLRD
jgi:biotin/methionine sulfoxide reductase